MRVFLLDLWLDLREKRLAPLAILLLAAVVAVPIVLAQGKEEPPAPPPTDTTATALPAGAAVVEGAPESEELESRLQTFSPRDPFEPTEVSAGSTVATDGGATGDTGGETTTGDTGTTDTGTAGGDVGGGGGGVTGTEPSGDTGDGTGGTGGTTGETRSRVFTYTVDLRFGRTDAQRLRKGVRRLQLLPNEDNPKLVFLGVTTTGKTAVFLVDNSLGVDTDEGRCRPSPDECTFLYLRTDGEHDQARFTDQNGDTYAIRLIDINRISVSSADGGSNSDSGSGDRSGRGDRAPAFTGSARGGDSEAAAGDTPPGEPSQPFTFQGFFRDEGQ